jgi:hypothetical protein
MSDPDIILVSQSNVVDYDAYSKLPLDRLDLFKSLVYPRMVHHDGEFRSHLDYLNFKEKKRSLPKPRGTTSMFMVMNFKCSES